MARPLKPLNWYRKLSVRKERLKAGAFLVEGRRAIEQIIVHSPGEIMEILSVEEPGPPYSDFPVRTVTENQLKNISQATTPQGIMAVVRLPLAAYTGELPPDTGNRVLLLEDVQDPGNTGTLIRTAAAFDYSGIIMTENCADPFSPKSVQSTAGAVLSLWIRRTNGYLDLAGELKKIGFTLVAADLSGSDDTSVFQTTDKIILALGNEAAGLSQEVLEMADNRLRIPISGRKAESLNVAACGAICMYLSTLQK